MKIDKYEIIIETYGKTAIFEIKGSRFTANRIYKFCCKNANMIEDIEAIFLAKNNNIIKQYDID